MRTNKGDKKEEANEFTKANVKKSTKKIINKIVANEDVFEYQLIENMFREKYPEYFREQRRATA